MSEIIIQKPETNVLTRLVTDLLARARDLMVDSRATHMTALDGIKRLREAERAVADKFREPKTLAHRAHKSITTLEREFLGPLENARASLVRRCGAYETAQARLEAAAKVKAQADQKRLEEATLEAAMEAEADGQEAQVVDAILATAPVEPVPVETQRSTLAGVHNRVKWSAKVLDLPALVKYVAERPEWSHLLQVNQAVLNQLARSKKRDLDLPGVQIVSEITKAIR